MDDMISDALRKGLISIEPTVWHDWKDLLVRMERIKKIGVLFASTGPYLPTVAYWENKNNIWARDGGSKENPKATGC